MDDQSLDFLAAPSDSPIVGFAACAGIREPKNFDLYAQKLMMETRLPCCDRSLSDNEDQRPAVRSLYISQSTRGRQAVRINGSD